MSRGAGDRQASGDALGHGERAVSAGAIVRVAEGRLSGTASADGRVRAFKGVPYARPPVGELRWRLPQRPEPWDGVRPADAFGPAAPQLPVVATSLYAGGHEHQSEDCLTLNVWTPASAPDERLPVMVWLHFGAYQFGASSVALYDGEALARAGVVVVTINHRLGRLGFLAHPALSAESAHGTSGNYGLHDQLQALHWLAENVAAFGGDPDCVTVFGLSAGSMSVSLLMASPLGRGLFHRAIGMSGATLGPVGASSGVTDSIQDLQHAEQTGLAVARTLGAASIAELRARTPDQILTAELPLGADRWTFDASPAPFARGALDGAFPIVDGELVPASPHAIYTAGGQAPVPLLTGSATGEASGMPYMADAARFTADARLEYGEHADEFLSLFPAADDEQARVSSATANGDRVFVWQNWEWARLHRTLGDAAVYYYVFGHEPPLPAKAQIAERNRGAFHSAEIPYVFRHLEVRDWPWTEWDRELSRTMSGYWVNFARGGDPNGEGLPRWPGFDGSSAMHFGAALWAGPDGREQRLAFWDAYYHRRRATA